MDAERELVHRLESAATTPQLLGAAYDVFELILAVLGRHDQPEGEYFLPMVMARAPAGNGRDCLLFAPSLGPRRHLSEDMAGIPARSRAECGTVRWLDAISRLLAAHLDKVAALGLLPGDRAACLRAAACAREITWVIGRGAV